MSQDLFRVRGKMIPLSCPDCSDDLSLEGYEKLSDVLKPRYWYDCKNCGFSRDVYDFKKELLNT